MKISLIRVSWTLRFFAFLLPILIPEQAFAWAYDEWQCDPTENCRSGSGGLSLLMGLFGVLLIIGFFYLIFVAAGALLNWLTGREYDDPWGNNKWASIITGTIVGAAISIPAVMALAIVDSLLWKVGGVEIIVVFGAYWWWLIRWRRKTQISGNLADNTIPISESNKKEAKADKEAWAYIDNTLIDLKTGTRYSNVRSHTPPQGGESGFMILGAEDQVIGWVADNVIHNQALADQNESMHCDGGADNAKFHDVPWATNEFQAKKYRKLLAYGYTFVREGAQVVATTPSGGRRQIFSFFDLNDLIEEAEKVKDTWGDEAGKSLRISMNDACNKRLAEYGPRCLELFQRYSNYDLGLSSSFARSRSTPVEHLIKQSDYEIWGWDLVEAMKLMTSLTLTAHERDTDVSSPVPFQGVLQGANSVEDYFGEDWTDLAKRLAWSVICNHNRLFIDGNDIEEMGEDYVEFLYRVALYTAATNGADLVLQAASSPMDQPTELQMPVAVDVTQSHSDDLGGIGEGNKKLEVPGKYRCPCCRSKITKIPGVCSNCGVGISFSPVSDPSLGETIGTSCYRQSSARPDY